MIAVKGYFDGSVIQTLEKLNAEGSLAKYANPNLISVEEGIWERAVRDAKENS